MWFFLIIFVAKQLLRMCSATDNTCLFRNTSTMKEGGGTVDATVLLTDGGNDGQRAFEER